MYLCATTMTCLQAPGSNDGSGPSNQPVQPAPKTKKKKRERAAEVSEACKSTLPPCPTTS